MCTKWYLLVPHQFNWKYKNHVNNIGLHDSIDELLHTYRIFNWQYSTNSDKPVKLYRLSISQLVGTGWILSVELISPVAIQDVFQPLESHRFCIFGWICINNCTQLKCNSDLVESHRLVGKYDSPRFWQDCHGAITLTDQPKWFNQFCQFHCAINLIGWVSSVEFVSTIAHFRQDCHSLCWWNMSRAR